MIRTGDHELLNVLGGADMRARNRLSALRIPPFDGIHEVRMFFERRLGPAWSAVGRTWQESEGALERVEDRDQVAISRGAVDDVVKHLGQPGQRPFVARLCATLAFEKVAERRDLRGRGLLRCETPGKTFEDVSHCIQLADLLLVQRCDDQTAARRGDQEPVYDEAPQGFADRCPADAQ